jgi:hypothetical protein
MATIGDSGQLSNLLKSQYEGPIREQINREAMIYSLFSEGPHEWSGANVIIPLHTAGVADAAIAYKAESAGSPGVTYIDVPDPSNQTYLQFTVDAKYLYGAFAVSGQAEAKAPGNSGGSEAAFVGAMFSEMRGLEKDIRSRMNKDMFGGGGIKGFLTDDKDDTTSSRRHISGLNHMTNGEVYRVWHVPRDTSKNWALVDDGTANADKNRFTITNIDLNKGEATLTSNTGGAGPDIAALKAAGTWVEGEICAMELITSVANDARPAATLREINGINTLGFGALTADVYSAGGAGRDALSNVVLRGFGMQSGVTANASGGKSAGTALALSDMQLVVDGIEELTEETIDTVIMHRFTRAEFRALTQENSRYLPGETSGKLGFKPGDLAFQDIPITVSKDVPYGCIYFLVSDTINTYTLKPGGFQNFTDNGDILTQKRNPATGVLTDVREGFWKQYYNLVSELPRAIGVFAGVSYKRA